MGFGTRFEEILINADFLGKPYELRAQSKLKNGTPLVYIIYKYTIKLNQIFILYVSYV